MNESKRLRNNQYQHQSLHHSAHTSLHTNTAHHYQQPNTNNVNIHNTNVNNNDNNNNRTATIGVKFSEKEENLRSKGQNKSKIYGIYNFFRSNLASILVFVLYLITLESIISCLLTVGLTLYWYFYAKDLNMNSGSGGDTNDTLFTWSGSSIDWVVLGFAVVTPITVSIGMAFRRRELALFQISQVRSFSFQIYLAHAIWNWDLGKGRYNTSCSLSRSSRSNYYYGDDVDDDMDEDDDCEDDNHDVNHNDNSNTNEEHDESRNDNDKVNWLEHSDQILEHLVGIGDELSRFLTLPTSSRAYHRMLQSGRREAAEIVELQYKLFDSFYTRRITKITMMTEKLKTMGLSATEASRLRQYERYIGEAVEGLRMVKMYRTPQALRSFGRMFTVLLPPLYAASFSQLAFDLHSLTMGILFAVITPLCLTALFESMQKLEDPFVGWTSLDGIDVAEELEILHWHQLKNAREEIFPGAEPFVIHHILDDALSGNVFMQRVQGGIFDLSLLQDTLMHHPATGTDGDTTARMSQFATDGSSKRICSVGEVGLDSSERISHYAMDASARSKRRALSNSTTWRHQSGEAKTDAGMDGSERISHYAMDASARSARRTFG